MSVAAAGMRVMLVDDHPIVQEIVCAVLARTLEPAEIHVEKDLAGALGRARAQAAPFDLVLLDLGLPGCSGITALTRFRKAFPKVPVIVISAVEDPETVRAALDAGARGYIPKTSSTGVMAAALRLVASGGTYVPTEALNAQSKAANATKRARASRLGLSERQSEVLRGIAKGLPNRQIARELGISENTVKQHARTVFRALGVRTRTGALVAAARRRIRFE